MYCKKCGYLITTGRFCPKCGTENVLIAPNQKPKNVQYTNEVSSFQESQTQGTSTPEDVSSISTKRNCSKKKSKKATISAVVLMVIVGTVTRVLIQDIPDIAPKEAVKLCIEAFDEQNGSKVLDCLPEDIVKDIENMYSISEGELEEDIELYLTYLEIESASMQNIDVSNCKVDTVINELEAYEDDAYVVWSEFDLNDISKAKLVSADYIIGNETYDFDYAYKYDGNWYSEGAATLAVCSAYYTENETEKG